LTDTAGLRDTTDRLESEGISRTHSFLEQVDLMLLLLDVSSAPSPQEQQLSERFPHAILIGHKADLRFHPDRTLAEQTLKVSSLTGDGIDDLVDAIVGRLIPRAPSRQTVFPVTGRQIDVIQFLHEHGSSAEPEMLSRKISELLSPVENPLESN
jgi:tRNA U34 5-carboxymethylaminomethyl modifying GTPase MnmE/TrmE